MTDGERLSLIGRRHIHRPVAYEGLSAQLTDETRPIIGCYPTSELFLINAPLNGTTADKTSPLIGCPSRVYYMLFMNRRRGVNDR